MIFSLGLFPSRRRIPHRKALKNEEIWRTYKEITLTCPMQMWCGDLVPPSWRVQLEAGAVSAHSQTRLDRGHCRGVRANLAPIDSYSNWIEKEGATNKNTNLDLTIVWTSEGNDGAMWAPSLLDDRNMLYSVPSPFDDDEGATCLAWLREALQGQVS